MKPDLTRVTKVRISILLPDGKRWDFVPTSIHAIENVRTELEYLLYFYVDQKDPDAPEIKIDGPYSAGVDPVKIGGVPG